MSEKPTENARTYLDEMKKKGIKLYKVADMSPEELMEYMDVPYELAKEIVNLARAEAEKKMQRKRKGNELTMLPHVGQKRAQIMKEKGLTVEKIASMKPKELMDLVPNLRRREAEDIIIAAEMRVENTLKKRNEFESELLNLPYVGISRAYKLHSQGLGIEKIAGMTPRKLLEILPDLESKQAERIIIAAEMELEKRKAREKENVMKLPKGPSRPEIGTLKIKRGLVNGNSLVNGKGVVNGLGVKHQRKNGKFPILALIVAIIIAITAPAAVMFVAEHTITIDGNFEDWKGIEEIKDPFGSKDGPLISEKFYVAPDRIYIYAQVNKHLFTDAEGIYLLVDTDRNKSTGYAVANIGAEFMARIIGWDGTVRTAEVYRYTSHDQHNWSSFSYYTRAAYGFSGKQIEFSIPIEAKNPVMLLFIKTESQEDYSDIPLTEHGAFIKVINVERKKEKIEIYTSGENRVHLKITPFGNPKELRYHVGLYIKERGEYKMIGGEEANITVNNNRTVYVIFNASGNGSIGFRVSGNESLNVINEVSPYSVNTSGISIDGNFTDWDDIRGVSDSLNDVEPERNYTHTNIDLSEIKRYGRYFYIKTSGEILAGDMIPEIVEKRLRDSDRDGVPDKYDPYPYDFNNDGIPDPNSTVVYENETVPDVDGDGIPDYPYGEDMWLNTTIPSNFPAPYGGKEVHRYIGPIPFRKIDGNDTFYVFIDDNGTYHAPFLPFGTSHMVVITGRGGNGSAWLKEYRGNKWIKIRKVKIAFNRNQLEGDSVIHGGIFVLSTDWMENRDLVNSPAYGTFTVLKVDSIPKLITRAGDATYVNMTLYWNGSMEFGNLTLINCTVRVNGTLELIVYGNFYMDKKTIITANGTGYEGGKGGSTKGNPDGKDGSGIGGGKGGMAIGGGGGGGGYGGYGGDGGTSKGGEGGKPYGTPSEEDIEMGSGGGGGAVGKLGSRYYDGGNGASGGGCIKVYGRKIIIEGGIYANGENAVLSLGGGGGGGSGGGILIYGKRIFVNGTLSARGGNGGSSIFGGGGGGGAGGRIKIFYTEKLEINGNINVSAGKGGKNIVNSANNGKPGDKGTEYYTKIPEITPHLGIFITMLIMIIAALSDVRGISGASEMVTDEEK